VGAVPRIYFDAFSHLIQNQTFSFKARNRPLPLDPVNARLSFACTLL
jgi:CRISPR/Cas system-associated endonuclease Cas1